MEPETDINRSSEKKNPKNLNKILVPSKNSDIGTRMCEISVPRFFLNTAGAETEHRLLTTDL